MLHLLLTYATDWTQDQLNQIVAEQLADGEFTMADSLRTAAMYCPLAMTPAQWVKACQANGINTGTARNRLNEVRRQQKEDGEI